MGLVGAAGALGWHRPPAARHPAPHRPGPRGAGRHGGPAAPDRGMDGVLRRQGGTARSWRTDRLASNRPASRDVLPSFAAVAKHYGVAVEPARRGGATGKAWWNPRTATSRPVVADDEAATSPRPRPRGWVLRRDRRRELRAAGRDQGGRGRRRAAARPAGPAVSGDPRVSRVAVGTRGGLPGQPLLGATGPGGTELQSGSASAPGRSRWSPPGAVLAPHRLAPDGAGTVRSAGHRAELERAVLSAFTTAAVPAQGEPAAGRAPGPGCPPAAGGGPR